MGMTFVGWGRKAKADPYGMTNKRTNNSNGNGRGDLLDGLDGEEHEVFDEAYLFLYEGLGVADAGE